MGWVTHSQGWMREYKRLVHLSCSAQPSAPLGSGWARLGYIAPVLTSIPTPTLSHLLIGFSLELTLNKSLAQEPWSQALLQGTLA